MRSARQGYVYVTCPLALARAARQLALLGKSGWQSQPGQPGDGHCRVTDDAVLAGDRLHLEAFEYIAQVSAELQGVAQWLAEHALPQDEAFAFFRAKIARDLVLLTDADFSYFVRNATMVEPHVRIDDTTGTASDGGLFYVENLPPESLLLAPLLASRERSGQQEVEAEAVLSHVLGNLDGKNIQIGGDATTGRGQVVVTALK